MTNVCPLRQDVFMDQLQEIGTQVPWMLTNGVICYRSRQLHIHCVYMKPA